MENSKILVFYLGVDTMTYHEINEYMTVVRNKFFNDDFIKRNNLEIILIPIREINSRIECINPKYITDEALIKEHEEIMKEYMNVMNKIIDQKDI